MLDVELADIRYIVIAKCLCIADCVAVPCCDCSAVYV